MKRLLCLLALLIPIFGVSCQQAAISSQTAQSTPVENTNPDTSRLDSLLIHTELNIQTETDYGNIAAFTEHESYPLAVEIIFCTVRNNNPGKGFYRFDVPFVERLQDGAWVRLDYQPPGIQYSNWVFCGKESKKSESQEAFLYFLPRYLQSKWTTGEYRLVVFAGKNTIYAPFAVTK